ncbi:MAG: hypothetical protein ACK4XJ_09650 [Fimbriimonadaceae bacterium]
MTATTSFERRLGVSRVDVRPGYTQVHVLGLRNGLAELRLAILKAVAAAGVSIDFLKLTHDGLSFLVVDHHAEAAREALVAAGKRVYIQGDRSIVLIHAVNMRDEEGLVAKIIQIAIETGARIEHVSDMHNRALLVVATEDAPHVAAAIDAQLVVTGR